MPALPVEELVTEQIVAALSASHLVQAVWDRIRETRPEMSEPEVVLPMRNLAGLWQYISQKSLHNQMKYYPYALLMYVQLLTDTINSMLQRK